MDWEDRLTLCKGRGRVNEIKSGKYKYLSNRHLLFD